MLVVLLLSTFFQNAGEESAVSVPDAIANINERLGLFLFVIIGGAAFAAFVLLVLRKPWKNSKMIRLWLNDILAPLIPAKAGIQNTRKMDSGFRRDERLRVQE
ncbi:MAG: hypothetical protein GXP06_14170 [Alphaproteobacteria bacterium]|nr:hypothetical protein [Alphaproteobacteria bacterium]